MAPPATFTSAALPLPPVTGVKPFYRADLLFYDVDQTGASYRAAVFLSNPGANQDTPELLPDYEASVGAIAKALKSYWGKEVSDPAKVAQVVLRLAASDRLPAHLLIGSDAVRFAGEAEKTREAEAAQWRQMSLSTDVDSSTVLPDMRF